MRGTSASLCKIWVWQSNFSHACWRVKFVYRLAAGGACDGDCLAFINCRQNLKTFWISLEEFADIESPAMVV